MKGERLATSQSIPLRFLENILLQLRHAGIIESRRGADGGYRLARPRRRDHARRRDPRDRRPARRRQRRAPGDAGLRGRSEPLRDVWVAVRASLRGVLEHVTLADVAANELPDVVRELVAERDAWFSR